MSQTIRTLAEADPDAEALIDGERTLTRAEVDRAADRLAHVLTAAGGRGGRIAWLMPNRAEILILAFAAQRLGALIIPLSYRSGTAELERMLAVAGAQVVVTDPAQRPILPLVDGLTVVDIEATGILEDSGQAAPELVIPPEGAPERLGAGASMLFTSGTTGAPKAAVRSRGDARLGATVAAGLGFGPGTRYLAAGPLYHSGPFTCALMALARGGVVGVQRRFLAAEWLAFAERHAFSATFITPTQLRRLVEQVEDSMAAPRSLRKMVVSGEPFPPELKRRAVAALGPCLMDCYGSTELGPLTLMPAEDLLTRPESCGRPFPGVDIAAFSGPRRLPPGTPGQLRARSPLAFAGYLNPETGEAVGPGSEWVPIGDVGVVDADGYVTLLDRERDLIISGGVNVFPADVEAVLREHPGVRDCAVVGLPDRDWGQIVCAAVVGDPSLTLQQVREWLRERIADDKRPRRLVHLPRLPLTATDKVSRRAVRTLLSEERATERNAPAAP